MIRAGSRQVLGQFRPAIGVALVDQAAQVPGVAQMHRRPAGRVDALVKNVAVQYVTELPAAA